jgi:acyl-CoA thioester hydrolase
LEHTSKINIRFKDIDAIGHVNNAVYLTYFEEARIAMFNALIKSEWNWEKYGVLLVKNEVEYLKPILRNNEIFIHTKIDRVGTKSFDVSYLLTNISQEIIYTKGKSVLVCFDHQTQQTISFPDEWRKQLQF